MALFLGELERKSGKLFIASYWKKAPTGMG